MFFQSPAPRVPYGGVMLCNCLRLLFASNPLVLSLHAPAEGGLNYGIILSRNRPMGGLPGLHSTQQNTGETRGPFGWRVLWQFARRKPQLSQRYRNQCVPLPRIKLFRSSELPQVYFIHTKSLPKKLNVGGIQRGLYKVLSFPCCSFLLW